MREDDCRKAAYYNECVTMGPAGNHCGSGAPTANCGSREGKPSSGAKP